MLTQTEWTPAQNMYFETIFTQANGYMGVRGYTEEISQGTTGYREGYLAGVFGQIDAAALAQIKVEYPWPMLAMITLPELFACELTLNGAAFSMMTGTPLAFTRTLDMRTGVLSRCVVWRSPAGHRTRLQFDRFLSAAVPHLAMQRITLTPENWSGTATLTFNLDGAIPTYFRCGDRAMAHLPQDILVRPRVVEHAPGLATLTVKTKGVGHMVSVASDVQGGRRSVAVLNNAVLRQKTTLALKQGKAGTVLRTVAVVSSRDVAAARVPRRATELCRAAGAAGYEQTLAASTAVWQQRWAMADIAIDGPARDQAYLRFSAFSMLQMAPFHTDRMSVPARAYAFNRYHGLYYWDSETFLLPHYLYTHPAVAEHLLSFRYHTLNGARRTAKHLKAPGACFPWMTDADDGTEQAPWYIGDYVWHQNADIAYAIDQYVATTGDTAFMRDKGLEVIIESARFWMSRLETYADGSVHLHNTVGPDEIDTHGKDNGYTSLLARHHLRLAVRWTARMQEVYPREARALRQRLAVRDKEVAAWSTAAARMAAPNVPGHDFPLQDEFLLAKKPLDFSGLTADAAFKMNHTHRVVKQADIILAMYLLQEDYTVAQMRAAYDFYEPMTLHYSSLSYNTHAIIAAKIGRHQQAYDYFHKAAGLDLDDLRKATDDGLHAAALGGTWQTVVYGFLGMRLGADALVLEPHLPRTWKGLTASLVYRGHVLRLQCTPRAQRIVVEGKAGLAPAQVTLNGVTHTLRDGRTITATPSAAPNAPAIKAVIFDLDGVIVSTDEFHFQAWKQLADAEGISFTRVDNERLRGVSRMESLEIILEKATRAYAAEEKHAMAERKNTIYRAALSQLSPADILPGVMDFLAGLRRRGIKIAIGSSSKNAGPILKAIGLHNTFDAVVDGTHIRRSKPDPEVFTLAGVRLGVPSEQCLVVEDAAAGVDAGLAAGMRVLAVGSAVTHPRASLRAADLTRITVEDCLKIA
jgi:alpha,alpha-trehalose phosphorylase